MLAAFSVAEPSDEPVLLPTRESKVPKPRQTLQFERPWDHFVPAKSVRKLTARSWVSKRFLLRRYRIRPLLASPSLFPLVTRRATTAMITSTAIAIPILSGVIKPG